MNQTIEAQAWPIAVVDALIAVEQREEPCWRVGRVLGSMLSFDFGGRIRRRALRRDVEVGTSTLSVRNCWWQFDGPSGSSIDSDQLNDGLAADMDRRLAGVVMARCRIQDRHLILDFSGDHRLQIDLNNRYEAADDDIIAELKLKGGVLLMLSHDGRFLLDAEASRSALQSAA